LRDARRPRSVMVDLITGGDCYSDKSRKESLQAQSWTEIVSALHYATHEFKKYPAFRGIAFSDYSGFEAILAPGQ